MSGRFHPAPVEARARVLIVDDHPLVREGLVARISAQPDLMVCGQSSDIDEALALIQTTRPALIIVDLALRRGNGIDLIKKVRSSGARGKILVVSAYEEKLFAERALRAGAQGYLNKQELQGTLIEAIRALLRGERYLSAETTQRLAGQALAVKSGLRGIEALSDRELQIFELIGRGHGTRSIAERLQRSVHTIESHREKIRAKLNLRSGSELLQHAMEWVRQNDP